MFSTDFLRTLCAMKTFANRLKELRSEQNITQAEFAELIAVSKSIVSYWETDNREPTGINLVKIADFFDVSVDFLLGRTNF